MATETTHPTVAPELLTAEAAEERHEPVTRASRDRIAMRAYELYLARGAADGLDFDDWLAAERELASSSRYEAEDRD